jgi:hypothetical protein
MTPEEKLANQTIEFVMDRMDLDKFLAEMEKYIQVRRDKLTKEQ